MSTEPSQDGFEYDVAFSFLGQDEAIAVQLNDLLVGRLRTFIYSEQQLKLAGTDGEESFASVFGKQAHSVVVLYRQAWGTTPWTRIEETAIRNRAHDEGFDFALFVPLDIPETKPIWLPKNRLRVGYNRWGIEHAAAVIERRVGELGGSIRTETIRIAPSVYSANWTQDVSEPTSTDRMRE
jgi:hypothetical protein